LLFSANSAIFQLYYGENKLIVNAGNLSYLKLIQDIHIYRKYIRPFDNLRNRIGGVMVRVLAMSAVDHGFEPRLGKTKDIKLVFVASPDDDDVHFVLDQHE
jgi:hypothetical protein